LTYNFESLAMSLTFLIADDNADAAESLGLLLEMEGHCVYLAHQGKQALEVANQVHPDVAILDIGMPLRDGFEVARQLRRQSWSQSMYIVALTGWGQQEDRRKSKEAGFDEHFTKPLDPMVLVQRVNEIRQARSP
jgi:DNA-binding response OmpR family regulator